MSLLNTLDTIASSNNVVSAYNDAPVDYLIKIVDLALTTNKAVFNVVEAKINVWMPTLMINLREQTSSLISPINPIQVFSILFLYIFVVFLPRFEVRLFSLFHNFCMVVLSAYMCSSILLQAYADKYTLFTNPVDHSPNGIPMAKIIWLFYISKIPEFVDTMIMLIKQNYRQISFLHVYHHSSIFAIWWVVTLMAPNGDAYFSAALNSFIHVVMYGYYLLSALGFKSVSFVKKYITMGQMTQFALNFIQASYNIVDRNYLRPQVHEQGLAYPYALSVLLWFYMISMLVLFANFYIQDRIRQSKLKSQQKGKKMN
ncbi:delta6 fatty acid elongase [Neoconidiobolus thromboides FSU 785]|nr:delta6 fatty acid elongase [Neoconidiobolus thromboides FSU 785]